MKVKYKSPQWCAMKKPKYWMEEIGWTKSLTEWNALTDLERQEFIAKK